MVKFLEKNYTSMVSPRLPFRASFMEICYIFTGVYLFIFSVFSLFFISSNFEQELFFTAAATAEFLNLAIYFWRGRKNLTVHLSIRIVHDNLLLCLSFGLGLWSSLWVGGSSVIAVLMMEVVATALIIKRKAAWYSIMVSAVIVSIYPITQWGDFKAYYVINIIVFSSFAFFTAIIYHIISEGEDKKKQLEDKIQNAEKFADMYKTMVRHELCHIFTPLRGYAAMGKITEEMIVSAFEFIKNTVVPMAFDDVTHIRIGATLSQIRNHIIFDKHRNITMQMNARVMRTTVKMKSSSLALVLSTLISNSIDAGASCIKINMFGSMLVVEDNGGGFDTGNIGEGCTTKRGGSGVGLVTSIALMEEAGVMMKISSKKDKGAVITLNFPPDILSEEI